MKRVICRQKKLDDQEQAELEKACNSALTDQDMKDEYATVLKLAEEIEKSDKGLRWFEKNEF